MASNEELIAKYETLLRNRPGDELVLFSLGKALFDSARWEEAQTHLTAALALKPDWMVVTILLAKIALARGDEKQARAHYEHALELAIAQHHEGPEEEARAALAKLPE